MSLASKLLMGVSGGTSSVLYSDDCFSAYTYTGNGSTQTITNGIDLAGKGGMVWLKSRSSAYNHVITDTARGVRASISTNLTAAEQVAPAGDRDVYAFTASGFSVGTDYNYNVNTNTQTFASWTFAKAARFFDVVTYTGNSALNRQIPHSLGVTPGMVIIKKTNDGTDAWGVWHRSLSGNLGLRLNTTDTQAAINMTRGLYLSSATHFQLSEGDYSQSNNTTGSTYVAYLFAHDASTDGIVQCGSFTTDGSGVIPAVNLGWEPQFLLTKASNAVTNWYTSDTSRSLGADASAISLYPNLSTTEEGSGSFQPKIGATGITGGSWQVNKTVIYLAIRRPNKPPTVGTQVYNAIARTGNNALTAVTGLGFSPDLLINGGRTAAWKAFWWDRLRGAHKYSISATTAAEGTGTTNGTQSLDMDGFTVGTNTDGENANAVGIINWCFKRAPGVFDQVCYNGTGVAKTEAHNLGAVPELMIVKSRSGAFNWIVYASALGNTNYIILDSPNAFTTNVNMWSSTTPTSSVFSIGGVGSVNLNTGTYVSYLFATKAGISKVGSYTGNATTNTIDCGFTTGARFVIIKRTDNTGDWYVWDTVRGIIAGNDPYLLLNSTAAEVTSTDYIDPSTAGFEISSTAPAAINASGGTFIYLAFA